MDWDEILNREDVTDLEAWRGELGSAHENMITGANARIAELEADVAEYKKKYEETAAHNYELMRSVTAEHDEAAHEDEELHATEDELGEEDRRVEDLFKEMD